jgi:hypothetical protein
LQFAAASGEHMTRSPRPESVAERLARHACAFIGAVFVACVPLEASPAGAQYGGQDKVRYEDLPSLIPVGAAHPHNHPAPLHPAAAEQQQATGEPASDRSGGAIAARLQAQQPPVLIRGRRPVQMALVTSPARMAAHPAHFFGVPVGVQGHVANIYNPHVFTLAQQAGWWSGADIPVLIPAPHRGATLERRPVVIASSNVSESTPALVQFRPALVLDVAEAQLAPRPQEWRQTTQSRPSQAPGAESNPPQGERGTARQQAPRRRSEARVD